MEQTYISVNCPINVRGKIALISDLHDSYTSQLAKCLKTIHFDYVVINGDLLYSGGDGHSIYDHIPNSSQHLKHAKKALAFLIDAVKIAPVIFSTGNHELYLDCDDKAILNDLGIFLLDNEFCRFGDIVFGGLSSPYSILAGTGVVHSRQDHKQRWNMIFDNVNTSWLDEFELQEGYKILLCHHPEFYEPFLKGRKGIDLILSGHAHGGQIRLFGRGLYAYGQGLFPKYTSGIYDNKLIVSRGLSNTSWIPRLWNPTEIIYVDLLPHFHN